MARLAKLNTNFSDMSDSLFSDACIIIFNLLTLNAGMFAGIPVAMGALGPVPPNTFGDLINRYNTIRLGAPYAGQVADTATARNNVQRVVTKNGNWLNTFANGDLALLSKTGYPLQKESEAQGKLDQSTLSVISLPIVNRMEFFITHVKGTSLRYGVMYTFDSNTEPDPSKWTFYYAGHRYGEIPGFIPGKVYKFVSFAMGTDLDLTYSEVVTVTAL